MHQIRPLGEFTALPYTPVDLREPTSKGRGKGGKENGGKGEEGRGREMHPST